VESREYRKGMFQIMRDMREGKDGEEEDHSINPLHEGGGKEGKA